MQHEVEARGAILADLVEVGADVLQQQLAACLLVLRLGDRQRDRRVPRLRTAAREVRDRDQHRQPGT